MAIRIRGAWRGYRKPASVYLFFLFLSLPSYIRLSCRKLDFLALVARSPEPICPGHHVGVDLCLLSPLTFFYLFFSFLLTGFRRQIGASTRALDTFVRSTCVHGDTLFVAGVAISIAGPIGTNSKLVCQRFISRGSSATERDESMLVRT